MSLKVELVKCPESSSGSIAAEMFTQKAEITLPIRGLEEGGLTIQRKAPRWNRPLKICAFVFFELLWLLFCLFVGLRTERLKDRTLTFFGFSVDSEQISQSTLSFIAGLYQTATLIFPGAIVADVYASEWFHLHVRNNTTPDHDKAEIDRVSLLTAGPVARFKHFVDRKRSSRAFSIAVFVSIFLIPLHSMMISTVTIGPAFISNTTELTIGTLPAISTFGDGIGRTDENARNLQLAARDAYISEVTQAFLDVNLDSFSPQALFGVPHLETFTEFVDDFIYTADAVSYNYTCQWVAPRFHGFDGYVTDSRWAVDDSGVVLTVDTLGTMVGNEATFFSSLYGFWPLFNADDFTPYQSGSLAWLLLGGNSTEPLSVINMSSIPESALTFNASGWFDLIPNKTISNAYLTQLASVIVCNPNVRYTQGEFSLSKGIADASLLDKPAQGGQIDHTGAEWMFGLGLDGVPSDTILTQLPLFNATDAQGDPLTDMSQIVFELMMQPPSTPGLGATVQELGNISNSLNVYMGAIGPNVFFDGSLGNTSVSAQFSRIDASMLQFTISWPYWLTSLLVVVVVTILLVVIIVKEGTDDNTLTIRKVIDEAKKRPFH